MNKYKFYKELDILKRGILTFFISCFALILFMEGTKYIQLRLGYSFLLEGVLNIILFLVLIILSFYTGFKVIRLINNNNEQEYKLQKLDSKINHKDNIIIKLRSQKHDYLKHLQVVYSLLNTGLDEDAKEYIMNISNSFKSKNSRYGKVSYLDAIASLKYEECLEKDISFDVYIQDFMDNLEIEPNDMSSVLLNIIDNAIESLSTIKKEKKYIRLHAYEDEFQYIIAIKNNGPKIHNVESIFWNGFSTKEGQDRGYGLHLVKNILDKYDYSILVNSDDFLTEFVILIPKYY
ncbi:histidine kinase-, DNA gyrase B-, and HSP90-like ATPase family protein [Clostridioides difficile Y312]|nr:histidine kinase-, DNA gyrase B-, and HSP90-like ATPase family protein [Clostridioides difficile CD18]EQE50270.1 histidine kinase-, DNA gyrase B-, and HSP90-like ATPase family protein [Clostridioides difficile CD40]EQI61892.1 histidine kinase-, DNA gyrase B-, and HSP90-like ATPase family protein [Clostridioides difficile Y312]EQJ04438.1 histidine kinase-, DNA gyrase B-, and HSP90-like ATPase family protein [Clostridioides difficile P6]